MRIGFSKVDITPPVGTELAGYAGYRPCSGVHDPLYCKVVLLEQEGKLYCLMALDLMCVDESLHDKMAESVRSLGITKERLIVCAIHTHAAPRGGIPGLGPLEGINNAGFIHNDQFAAYMEEVCHKAVKAAARAAQSLDTFKIRVAQGPLPQIGSERHTGEPAKGALTVLHFRTAGDKNLMVYNLACHPTVLSAANLEVSADFVGGIEERLHVDMGVFLNGAAGDISTRFTRKESSFAQCAEMADRAASAILEQIDGTPFVDPLPLKGYAGILPLRPRRIEPVEQAENYLEETTRRWEKAVEEGADPATQRILRTYMEGAGVSLEFSRLMGDITRLHLPVTVFTFGGLNFVTIPGELFSDLLPDGNTVAICYANGYYRYIAGQNAYDAGYYEAMAAILAPGEAEVLTAYLDEKLREINK